MLRRFQSTCPTHPKGFAPPSTSFSPLVVLSRHATIHESDTVRDFKFETDAEYDPMNRSNYLKKRQEDAIAYAIKEKELLQKMAMDRVKDDEYENSRGERRYQRSIERFPMKKKITKSYTGLAENRVIQLWENIWYNYVKYFFNGKTLIGKDRYGNRFFSQWNFTRSRQEARFCYRCEAHLKASPYGTDMLDDKLWVRWLKHHRGDPPTVAEEEFNRAFRKDYSGPIIHQNDEVEDALMRASAQVPEMGPFYGERDPEQEFDNNHRTMKPERMIQQDLNPGHEMSEREKGGQGKARGTWHQGLVRPDLFYNEEETEAMKSEIHHMFRSMEWQELEYKRQVRMRKAQKPHGLAENAFEDTDAKGEPMQQIWERMDVGIPYHDAVPDLSSPELERLRLETEQLDDHRLAIRIELGLTDLGDIREGRPPIDKGEEPYRRPLTKDYKPRVWDEAWGSQSFRGWD